MTELLDAQAAEITRLRSACVAMSRALSRIDYLLGEPNEMEVSGYDVHADPEAVVRRVATLIQQMRELEGAAREAARLAAIEKADREHTTHCEVNDLCIECQSPLTLSETVICHKCYGYEAT